MKRLKIHVFYIQWSVCQKACSQLSITQITELISRLASNNQSYGS